MKEHMEINKAIWDLKMVIKKSHTFNGARWKRTYFNNPGVYNIILNIQQLTIIHKALKKLNKQENQAHLNQKWNRMIKEIFKDHEERIKKGLSPRNLD